MYVNRERQLLHVVAAVVAMSVIGCGGPANKYDAVVSGTVTIEGELAPSGTVTFHPVAKEGKIAIGRIYPDGSFALRTGQGDLRESDGGTVVPGEYIVTVVVNGPAKEASTPEGGPPRAGPLLIAERYISRDTTELRKEVVAGENVFVFDLKRATPNAAAAEPADEKADDADAADGPPAAEASPTDSANPAASESIEGASP